MNRIHTGAGLVKRTIQPLKSLIVANLDWYKSPWKRKQGTLRSKIQETFRNQENTVRIRT